MLQIVFNSLYPALLSLLAVSCGSRSDIPGRCRRWIEIAVAEFDLLYTRRAISQIGSDTKWWSNPV
ncbi:MAG: hypothetical protein ACLTTP_12535 [Alistipes ihumii]